jgi:hypothetical protein
LGGVKRILNLLGMRSRRATLERYDTRIALDVSDEGTTRAQLTAIFAGR